MMRLARWLAAVSIVAGCSKESAPAEPGAPPSDSAAKPVPPDPDDTVSGSKPQERTVVEQPITLKLPAGASPDAYQQVRADATLGPALDREMIPALEKAGPPADRIAAFTAARDAALAGWKAPPGTASKATGPQPGSPHPIRRAFDLVSTDALRAWFFQVSEAVAAGGRNDQSLATLTDLETRARGAFAWDSGAAESVAVRVMLVRKQLEQK